MNITETSGTWKLEGRLLTNLKLEATIPLNRSPNANAVAYMSEKAFVSKCEKAFATGAWPN